MMGFILNLLNILNAIPIEFEDEKKFKIKDKFVEAGITARKDGSIDELYLIPDVVATNHILGVYQRKEDGWYKIEIEFPERVEWNQGLMLSGIVAEYFPNKKIHKGE